MVIGAHAYHRRGGGGLSGRQILVAIGVAVLFCIVFGTGMFLLLSHLDAQTSLPIDPNQWVVETCPGTAKPQATPDGTGIQSAWPPQPGCIGAFTFNFKHPMAIS